MSAMRDFAVATADLAHAIAMGGGERRIAECEAQAQAAFAELVASSA